MAMALGLTKCIEKLAPDLYKEETRRGSILSGKLVTRKESMKEPVPACIRRKRQSLVPPKSPLDNISGGASGRTTPGTMSRKDSLSEDAMEALKRFQLTNPKMGSNSPGRQSPSNQQETLGNALRMIKKRRSLFEHASVFGYGTW